MPVLKIVTNIPKSKIPDDFLVNIVPILSASVRKPPEAFICSIEDDCKLLINCNAHLPAAVASLESIGHLGPEENNNIAKMLTSYIEKSLGIVPDRFILTFYDLKSYQAAKSGVTIANLQ